MMAGGLKYKEDYPMDIEAVKHLVKFIGHKNKKLLYYNFSGLNIDEVRQLCEYAKELIQKMPLNSVLTMVNAAEVQYDDAFNGLSKELAAYNKPYVLAGAVIGVDGWRKLVFWATTKLTGRDNLKLFGAADADAAKDWLVSYRAD